MGHFRGSIQGARGEASRLGTKKSGLDAHIASWQGAVSVRLWYDKESDMDMAAVELVPHYGNGMSKMLYRGPVSGAPIPSDDDDESDERVTDLECNVCGAKPGEPCLTGCTEDTASQI